MATRPEFSPLAPLATTLAPRPAAPPYEPRLAFERTRAARDAIHPKAVVKVNRKIAPVVSLAYLAVDRVAKLRPDIIASLAAPNLAALDRLEDAANALLFADQTFVDAQPRENKFIAVVAEGNAVRKTLVVGLVPLVDAGLITLPASFRVQKTTALQTLSRDLGILGRLYLEAWDRIAGKTAVTKGHLDRAAILARVIGRNCAERRIKDRRPSAVSDDRDRAFTLLLQTYSEVRSMVAYVRRRERDAARFAPSLYARSKKAGPASAIAPAEVSPCAGSPEALPPICDAADPAAPARLLTDPGSAPLPAIARPVPEPATIQVVVLLATMVRHAEAWDDTRRRPFAWIAGLDPSPHVAGLTGGARNALYGLERGFSKHASQT